jgi:hypothetical protein
MKHKGILLAIVICGFAMIPVKAQLTVGGFIDLNIATFNVNPGGTGEDYSSYLGFGLGGIAAYEIANGLAIQGEPMILQKGGKITEGEESITLKVLYFDIPLLLSYKLPLNSETVLPYVMAGPNLGFRASAKINYPDGSKEDAGDEFSGIDLGLGLGGGVEVPYDNLIFFGETRYVFGLNNINKESDEGESKVMNRGLQIILGVKVPLSMN